MWDYCSGIHNREDHHMHIASIGIDLGKNTFHLVALEELNEVLVSQEVLPYTALGFYGQSAA
jgi:hypothetical protein